MSSNSKKILIIYEFFYPAFKAGGIIRSLENIISKLDNEYDFYVVTGGYDLGEQIPLKNIELDAWNNIQLKQSNVKVWYDRKKNSSPNKWKEIIKTVNPDIVYINGFMHLQFLLYPLIAIQSFKHIKTIIAPRGMLQKGAINVKPLKKFFYLQFIKSAGLTKNVRWHFTSEAEAVEAQKLGWGINNATIIPNLFHKPVSTPAFLYKEVGIIKLVYASIITPKKNLLYLIETIALCTQRIELNIYGVIKEIKYWEECKRLIAQMPNHISIQYQGSYHSNDITDILVRHHAMILLSKAENFSHAIVESLSAGRPVITSEFTSWDQLEAQKAGWNISIEDKSATASAIDQIAKINNKVFETFYSGALQLANNQYVAKDYVAAYKKLFG
jgi:glycosyltransferase involved in cell wall biosynthesis